MSNAIVTAWPSEEIDPCEAAFFSEKPLPPMAPREEVLEALCVQITRARRIRGAALIAFFALLLTGGGYLATSDSRTIPTSAPASPTLAVEAPREKLPQLATASVVVTRTSKAKPRNERSTSKRSAASSRRK